MTSPRALHQSEIRGGGDLTATRGSPQHSFRVVVTASWVPGGVTTWAHEFANELADRGHRVACLFVKARGLLLSQPPAFKDARYEHFWLSASPHSFLSVAPRFISSYLEHHGADFIVSTGPEGARIPGRASIRARPLHIGVVHVPDPAFASRGSLVLGGLRLLKSLPSSLGWLKRERLTMTTLTAWYWQWVQYLDMRRLQHADIAVCVSHFQGRAVQGAWGIPDRKIHVLYNGIDTTRFRPKPHPPRDGERRLLFAGGTNPRKGADLILEAFAVVSKHHPDVSLDLVGGWNWAVHRERARRLDIASRVRFLPYVAHAEMPDYYLHAYALVAPTRSESFGRVLAEAMACGIPVISTQTGAVPEIVQHGVTGILVPRDDVEALTRAILAVLEDPASAMWMGENGRKLVVDSYAWSVIIHRWEELLRRLTARYDIVAEQGNVL